MTTMLATPEESGEGESPYPYPVCYEDPRFGFEETDHGDQLAIQINDWHNRG